MPRKRSAERTAEGLHHRRLGAAVLEMAVSKTGSTLPAFAAQAGTVLYGTPYDRSTAYRWRRAEVAIPAEVLTYALALAGIDILGLLATDEVGDLNRLGRIETALRSQGKTLKRLEARLISLETKM